MAKLVDQGVLTVMFAQSTSDLEASWWTVDCGLGQGEIGGPGGPHGDACAEHKRLESLLVDGGLVHGEIGEQGGPYSDV